MVQSTSFSFFLYEITFFLAFGQAEILAVLFKYCFVTKRSLNYITHRKTFQNKKRAYFNKMYFYHVLCCKGMVKPVSGKPPPPPKTSPPWGVRGRVSVRLGIALGLRPGGAFFRGEFFLEPVKPYYIKGVHGVEKNICWQMFYKVVVPESFAKFTGKHLCWSHFLIKLQA